ncbi:aldehyde dehydrogenase [Moraxella caviae]|uniref:Aldehyde dehydrogenase n=1 Tax=Moraxella caviae TaxID=34060 RepID=A0A1S9ZWE5_9GAMM|nr:aldehyde dehydrogenase family protein [Moraxella caviae]OOR87798.1 aldehyde dehydrogenase [Moraxella caviae]STZ10554.1 Betaine aldehyde dehydrogenase [Moraxella caviae]VEW12974.1 Betaine aldehyde dehydrogenase [Moraxella caviae]
MTTKSTYPLGDYQKLYINGAWVSPTDGATFESINPYDESVITHIAKASQDDALQAVQAARHAFDDGEWCTLSGKERAAYLRAIAAKIHENLEYLAYLEVLDNGKPIDEARWDIADTAGCFEFYAQLAEELDDTAETPVVLSDERFDSVARREAVGVAVAIIPWNYPMLMAAWKVAPALAAGCTMVLKPAEATSMTAIELGRIAEKVGLPKGVLNIVTGFGSELGDVLTTHPDVDKVAFTGSVPVGKHIMQKAASNVKNLSLELGGKSAFVVFDDSDIEQAVEWILFGIFWNQGQVCSATSRLLIQNGIYDKLMDRLVAEAKNIRMGSGLDIGVKLGPLVNEKQYRSVLSAINKAQADGIHMATGGKADFVKGYFVAPTIFTDVPTDHELWTTEVFGPVLAVRRFDDEAEAIRLANDSQFGLAAAVMSADDARCQRVARAFCAGIVWINCSQPTFTEAPWGGYKQSGIGRELGEWGLNNYLETKQITRYHSQQAWGWYL